MNSGIFTLVLVILIKFAPTVLNIMVETVGAKQNSFELFTLSQNQDTNPLPSDRRETFHEAFICCITSVKIRPPLSCKQCLIEVP